MNNSKIIIIGSRGFIGSSLLTYWKDHPDLFIHNTSMVTPTKEELDITNYPSILAFLRNHPSATFLNLAAFTNVKLAENQRDDKMSSSWQINVLGVNNLIKACSQTNSGLIQISTDSVFSASHSQPGPYTENVEPIKDSSLLSWYGYTKLIAEEAIKESYINFTIVRIAYPFGNLESDKDYTVKLVQTIKSGYPLFGDQFFTPTFIPDLAVGLNAIISNALSSRIFHIASKKITTPFEIGTNLKKLISLKEDISLGSLVEYKKITGNITYGLQGGLLTDDTEKTLEITFHDWQQAMIELYKTD